MLDKKVDLVLDLQFGSTGKGLIAGYLGQTRGYDMVMTANMPNSGHTYVDNKGQKMVHKVLPNGLVSPNVKRVVIGAGAVFSLDQLRTELAHLEECGYFGFDLHIHENATVLLPRHKEAEEELQLTKNIGSTGQGTIGAMMDKIVRAVEVKGEPDYVNPVAMYSLLNTEFEACLMTQVELLEYLSEAKEVLLEGSQGYSLGINAGFYPFCTSKDCTPPRYLMDAGIPHSMLRTVIGTARMHPIRVGGNSGPHYSDQIETTWEDLGVNKEYTTVTGRERRVFTWSQDQIREAMMMCQPDEVFLNFCNYDPTIVEAVVDNISLAAKQAGCAGKVKYTGWGDSHRDIKESE